MSTTDKPSGVFDKVAIMAEGSFGAGAQPAVTAFLPFASLSVDASAQPGEDLEINYGHPGRYDENPLGVEPAALEIDTYYIGSGTGGTAVPWRTAAFNAGRMSESTYSSGGTVTVVDYTQGAGDTVTVTTIIAGTTTANVLTEGVDFAAGASNDACATAMAAAIDALTGVSATSLAAVVTVTASTGTDDVGLATGDASAWTVSDLDDRLFYTLTENTVTSCAIYTCNANECEMAVGCIVQTIAVMLAKDNKAKLTLSASAARVFGFSATTLNGGIDDSQVTLILSDTDAVDTGIDDTSESGLYIPITIESEHLIITAYNWSTGTATVTRGAYGSSGAAHIDAKAVTPYNPTPTWAAGTIPSAVDWTFTDDAVAYNLTSLALTIETGVEFIVEESGYAERTDIQCLKPTVSGEFVAVAKDANSHWHRDGAAGTQSEFRGVAGTNAGAGSILDIEVYRARVRPVSRDWGSEGVRELTRTFDAKDTAAAFGSFHLQEH